MKPERIVYLMTALGALVAAVLSFVVGWNDPTWWATPALAVGVGLGSWHAARLVISRQGMSFGLSDIALAIALVARPGAWIVVAMGLGVGAALVRNRVQPMKIGFNVAQTFLATAIAASIGAAIGGGVLGAAAGLPAFIAVNQFAVASVISITANRPLRSTLRAIGSMGVMHYLSNASIGLLAGWLVINEPIGILGLAAPMLLLVWSYRQQTERAAEARLFAELARGREQTSATSLDTSAQVVVTAAARLFGGAEVELLLRHPSGPVRYLGDENGVTNRERVDSGAFSATWALRTLGSRTSIIGVDGDRPFCSAALGDHVQPAGVFIARRPARAGAFTSQDARLVEVLVGQAETWLTSADLAARHGSAVAQMQAYGDASKALGDLGADTSTSLMVLRESTDRLSRLATTFTGPDPVAGIVDELHTVERAVASLLGAIALATEEHSDRAAAAPEPTGARRPVRNVWTTTGLLDSHDLG